MGNKSGLSQTAKAKKKMLWLALFLLLGVMLALIIPLAGLRCHSKGLQPWLYAGAALLAVTLCYQYLETTGVVHSALLLSLFTLNGQVILVEGAAAGFMTVTALLSKH